MEVERLPPHDLEVEEAVIGSLLVEGEALSHIEHILRPEDFFREPYRWAYEACLELADRSEAINPITVAHELERRGRLEELGGSGQLQRLVAQVPTSVHIEHYARLVVRTSLLRRLINAAGQIAALSYQETPDIDAVLDKAEALLRNIRSIWEERYSPSVVSSSLEEVQSWLDKTANRLSFEAAVAFFEQHREELLKEYAGKCIAIIEEQVADSDTDRIALARRIYDKYGYREIYMPRVESVPRVVHIPSPQLRPPR